MIHNPTLFHGWLLILGTDAWAVMNCIKTATHFFLRTSFLPPQCEPVAPFIEPQCA
ncbi:hypothetical protein K469DRAFT_707111 [Zopfia rhizophila CBS 207.26]|uniref:Uncharacterized protein n=1 Tax=Zopfia rhizophila CBS 207.26 TaxID=1314779 RepID=A0A6A6D8H3_9PEZI|nr:hypothetical protein K469DRAFT_707111 [Zopfia rhizophila CBS 207.26]